jgi:hypothetical protein
MPRRSPSPLLPFREDKTLPAALPLPYPLFPLACRLSLSLCFSFPRARPNRARRPSPRPAASRLPASRRARPEVRHLILFLPSAGIDAEHRESTPSTVPSPQPDRAPPPLFRLRPASPAPPSTLASAG